jgi:hypothetical protein
MKRIALPFGVVAASTSDSRNPLSTKHPAIKLTVSVLTLQLVRSWCTALKVHLWQSLVPPHELLEFTVGTAFDGTVSAAARLSCKWFKLLSERRHRKDVVLPKVVSPNPGMTASISSGRPLVEPEHLVCDLCPLTKVFLLNGKVGLLLE